MYWYFHINTDTAATDSISSGTASVTIPPWDDMVAGKEYDVFIFVYTVGRSSGLPSPGDDYVYKSTGPVPWFINGNWTIRPAYEEFIVIPTE